MRARRSLNSIEAMWKFVVLKEDARGSQCLEHANVQTGHDVDELVTHCLETNENGLYQRE